MTQYLLSVHHDYDGPQPPADEMEQAYKAVDQFNADIQASGAWVFAGGLAEPSSATVVSAHQPGEPLLTDGPYAETKEALGGFWVIEASDLDAALDVAKRASAACMAPVEVRPFQDDPEPA